MPAKSKARGRKRKSAAAAEDKIKSQVIGEEVVPASQSTGKYAPRFGSAVKKPRPSSSSVSASTQPGPAAGETQSGQQAAAAAAGTGENAAALEHTTKSDSSPGSSKPPELPPTHCRGTGGEDTPELSGDEQPPSSPPSFIPGLTLSQVVRSPEAAPVVNDSLEEEERSLEGVVPIALVGSKGTLSQSIHSEKNLSFLNPFEDEADTSAPQCAESNHIKRDSFDGVIPLAPPMINMDSSQVHHPPPSPLPPPSPDTVLLPSSQEQLRHSDTTLTEGGAAKSLFDSYTSATNKDVTFSCTNTDAKSLLDDSIEDAIVHLKHDGALEPTAEDKQAMLDTSRRVETPCLMRSQSTGLAGDASLVEKPEGLLNEPTEEDYAAVHEMMMDISATELIGSQFGDEAKGLLCSPPISEAPVQSGGGPVMAAGRPETTDCLEGTALLRGLIDELSALNRFVVNCNKELEGMQRKRQVWQSKPHSAAAAAAASRGGGGGGGRGGGGRRGKGYRQF